MTLRQADAHLAASLAAAGPEPDLQQIAAAFAALDPPPSSAPELPEPVGPVCSTLRHDTQISQEQLGNHGNDALLQLHLLEMTH